MATDMTATLRPFRPIRPGEILQEEMEARGWTQADLARIVGRPVQAVNEIVRGKKAITAKTAVSLSHALGTSPGYWLNLESAYRLDLERPQGGDGDAIERRARLHSLAPVKEILKRKWIDARDMDDVDTLERRICRFLGISSPRETPRLSFAARKSRPDETHSPAQCAWVCRVRRLAGTQRAAAFSRERLETAVHDLPKLSALDAKTRTVPQVLARLGIRFVCEEHLPGTRIDGATLWLNDRAPVVALSLRYDRLDYFWFTLLHELAHVLHGDGMGTAILDDALVGRDAEGAERNRAAERRADQRAGEWLIPEKALREFVVATKPYYSRKAVRTFAEKIGVHPAIVVGRLQFLGEIPWTHLRNLLAGVRRLLGH